MSNKEKGSRVERELIKLFTENSWRAIRVAGSGIGEDSPCDLIAAKRGKKAHVIEVKSSKKTTIYITKQQIEDFILFSSIIGLTPVIALRFNREGWFFIDPKKHLKDTGKYWSVSLETAREKGKRFSHFFENEMLKKSSVKEDYKISEEILNELDKEDLGKLSENS